MTLHPGGKKGVNIEVSKYDRVRSAILDSLDVPKRFDLFFEDVKARLDGFEGSLAWYVETVKLDLEARSLVVHDRKTRMISRP